MFQREKPSSDQRFRLLTSKNILYIYFCILNKINAYGNRFNNSQQIPCKPSTSR